MSEEVGLEVGSVKRQKYHRLGGRQGNAYSYKRLRRIQVIVQ